MTNSGADDEHLSRQPCSRARSPWSPGGGTGIGRGIAEALARHGADVAIVSRKPENLDRGGRADRRGDGPALPADRRRRPPARGGRRGRRPDDPGAGRAGHRRQQRRRQLLLPVGRPEPQRLRHGDRHRRQGDVERLAGRLSGPAQGSRRPDPQHQRHAALRRHARPGPRRRGQGGRRRDDPHPGRRVGAAGHPGQRDRPGPDRRYRGRPPPLPRRPGRSACGP